jgi:hypothetical protein
MTSMACWSSIITAVAKAFGIGRTSSLFHVSEEARCHKPADKSLAARDRRWRDSEIVGYGEPRAAGSAPAGGSLALMPSTRWHEHCL